MPHCASGIVVRGNKGPRPMSETLHHFMPAQGLDVRSVVAQGRAVVRAEAAALAQLEAVIDEQFVRACTELLAARRVVACGMGKSGHIARKIAATLCATGTPAAFLHPAEAAHGDLGMVARGDVLLVLSNSGTTRELAPVMAYARRAGVPVVAMVADAASPVAARADVVLALPQVVEACAQSLAPTTSTTQQLAMGDALAMAVMSARGVSAARMRAWHPGGAIGLKLTPLAELMHGAGELPLVLPATPMDEVMVVISRFRFGLAGVVDGEGALVGVISDGDLRRHFATLATARAADVMTQCPVSMPPDMLATEALRRMNDAKITAAFVVEPMAGGRVRPSGIIHIHDLLQKGAV